MTERILLTILFSLFITSMVHGQANPQGDKPIGYTNWTMKTMGGRQFWTDVRHLDGWRIQKSHMTGHHRLLDSEDYRHAWGNLAHCNQKLNSVRDEQGLRDYSGKVVVLLHGLVRSHSSMVPLAEHLQANGYEVLNFQYASSRGSIGEHAESLATVLEQFSNDVSEINFVGHSMGNLVVRHYLRNHTDPNSGEQGDSRIRRMVMIGPPNQGSRMAELAKYTYFFGVVAGTSGMQLSSAWDQLEPQLATPNFEFGIIAGGQSDQSKLSNFLLDGKDDLTVSVEETKLPGAHDFLVKPMLHGIMMKKQETLDATLSFFQHGYFESHEKRNPLPRN